MKRNLSRRKFLGGSVLSIVGLALAKVEEAAGLVGTRMRKSKRTSNPLTNTFTPTLAGPPIGAIPVGSGFT